MSTTLKVLPLDPSEGHPLATAAFYVTLLEAVPFYRNDPHVRLKVERIPQSTTDPIFDIDGLWSSMQKILRKSDVDSGIHFYSMDDIIAALDSAIRFAQPQASQYQGFLPFVIDDQPLQAYLQKLRDIPMEAADYPGAIPVLDLLAEESYVRFRFRTTPGTSCDVGVSTFQIDQIGQGPGHTYTNIPWPTIRWAIVNAQGSSSLRPGVTEIAYALEKGINHQAEGQFISVIADADHAADFINSVNSDPDLLEAVHQTT